MQHRSNSILGHMQHRSNSILGHMQHRSNSILGHMQHRSNSILGQMQHNSILGHIQHRSNSILGHMQHRSNSILGTCNTGAIQYWGIENRINFPCVRTVEPLGPSARVQGGGIHGSRSCHCHLHAYTMLCKCIQGFASCLSAELSGKPNQQKGSLEQLAFISGFSILHWQTDSQLAKPCTPSSYQKK